MSDSYPPLNHDRNEIRLLKVRRDWYDKSQVCIEPLVVSLDSGPRYHALSYVWGPDPGTRVTDASGSVSMTPSLHAAFKHVFGSPVVSLVWVDALCIDQANISERNEQVQKMAEIYKKAQVVHIWLGEMMDQSADAMQFIKQLSRNLHLADIRIKGGDVNAITFGALGRLMGRAWWHRLWVVQEVSLAREAWLHCGNEVRSWEACQTAARHAFLHKVRCRPDYCKNQDNFALEALGRFIHGAAQFEVYQGGRPLLEMVAKSRARGASDPRDRIYALLGLVSLEEMESLAVDYNLSVSEVYQEIRLCHDQLHWIAGAVISCTSQLA